MLGERWKLSINHVEALADKYDEFRKGLKKETMINHSPPNLLEKTVTDSYWRGCH